MVDCSTFSYDNRREHNFNNQETSAIIAVWGSIPIQQKIVDGCRYSIIYDEIANELRKEGYVRSGTAIRKKISNLRQRYHREKRVLESALHPRVSTWPFWDAMHYAMSTLSTKTSLRKPKNDIDSNNAAIEEDHRYTAHYLQEDGTNDEDNLCGALLDQSLPSEPVIEPPRAFPNKRKRAAMNAGRMYLKVRSVLHSNRVGQRNSNFRDDETRTLIAVWGSRQIREKFRTVPLHALVYEEMSRILRRMGYGRSGPAIRKKLDNLKAMYNICRKRLDSGATSAGWLFWDDMHRAMSAYLLAGESLPPPANMDIETSEAILQLEDFGEDDVDDFSADVPETTSDSSPGVASVSPSKSLSFGDAVLPQSDTESCLPKAKKRRARISNFKESETRALIAEWSMPRIQRMLAFKRTSVAYEELSQRLRQRGVFRPVLAVWKKIRNLQSTYQSEKKAMSLGASATTWPFWDAMHQAMTTRMTPICNYGGDVGYERSDDDDVGQAEDDDVDYSFLGKDKEGETASLGVPSTARLARGYNEGEEEEEEEEMTSPGVPPNARFARGSGLLFLRKYPRDDREMRLLQQVVDTDKRFLAIAERQLKMEEESRAKKDKMIEAQTRFYDSFAQLAQKTDDNTSQTTNRALDVMSRFVATKGRGFGNQADPQKKNVVLSPISSYRKSNTNNPVFYKIIKAVPAVRKEPPK